MGREPVINEAVVPRQRILFAVVLVCALLTGCENSCFIFVSNPSGGTLAVAAGNGTCHFTSQPGWECTHSLHCSCWPGGNLARTGNSTRPPQCPRNRRPPEYSVWRAVSRVAQPGSGSETSAAPNRSSVCGRPLFADRFSWRSGRSVRRILRNSNFADPRSADT